MLTSGPIPLMLCSSRRCSAKRGIWASSRSSFTSSVLNGLRYSASRDCKVYCNQDLPWLLYQQMVPPYQAGNAPLLCRTLNKRMGLIRCVVDIASNASRIL